MMLMNDLDGGGDDDDGAGAGNFAACFRPWCMSFVK